MSNVRPRENMENTTAVEALVWLEQELTGSGIAFEQVQHALAVGFTLVGRCGPRRASFAWNPSGAVLSVSYASADDRALVHDAFISVPNGEGLYAEIASEATSLLAV